MPVTDSGGRRITGYAAVFNSESRDLGFTEVLAPGCFRDALASRRDDVLLLWGHDQNKPLARVSAGTLTLAEDGHGLRFEATLSDTQAGRDALVLIRDGVVKGCSFGFTVDEDQWRQTTGGNDVRIIQRVGRLLEVTLTGMPAYPATSVEARQRATDSSESSPYRVGGRWSWFADRANLAMAQAVRQATLSEVRGGWRGQLGDITRRGIISGTDAAEKRLRLHHAVSRRDVTTADPGAGPFVPTGAPTHVATAFAGAVRARAVLGSLLPHEPLPELGMTVSVTRITTPPSVAVQAAQLAALSETDLDTDVPTTPVATIAGIVDASLQAWDRTLSGYDLDVKVAADLGDALATDLDRQLLNGTGASGQLGGILGLSGAFAATYLDATPTFAELWPVLLSTRSSVAGALGYSPTVVLLHPRRASWLASQRDTAGAPVRYEIPGVRFVECPTMPTTLGGGTEDAIIILEPSEVPIAPGPINIEILPEVNSAIGAVRLRAYMYAASLASRRPEAIGRITGTGLAPPVFA